MPVNLVNIRNLSIGTNLEKTRNLYIPKNL